MLSLFTFSLDLMTYDYNGCWSPIATHHNALYYDPAAPTSEKNLNIDFTIKVRPLRPNGPEGSEAN